jgi:glyoxylase-like metal-dependent hydrolase (beta-lactamase superfamily II)
MQTGIESPRGQMKIQHFFDETTNTLTYLIYDERSCDAVVIDPVLNFDYASGVIKTHQLQNIIDFVQAHSLVLHYVLETHVHADHLTSAAYLKKHFPLAKILIGNRITEVQKTFQIIFNLFLDFATDGSQFDRLLDDNDIVQAGCLKIRAIKTAGHTPCCLSYLINEQAIFTGDALFMPDYGTGRCDFPGGNATQLYRSIHKNLYQLPGNIQVFVGHDYLPNGRNLLFQSTIEEEKKNNIHLSDQISEIDFVNMRQARDKKLSVPKLLYPSLQVNMRAGNFPSPEENDVIYLKLPLKI